MCPGDWKLGRAEDRPFLVYYNCFCLIPAENTNANTLLTIHLLHTVMEVINSQILPNIGCYCHIKVGLAEIVHVFFLCTNQSVFRSYFDPRLPFSPDDAQYVIA